MKRLLILTSLMLTLFVGKTMAGNASGLFSYDAVAIENQMAPLDQLEGYLLENPGTTLAMLTSNANSLADIVGDTRDLQGFNMLNEKTLGIPGFVWGCCLGGIGVLVVYLAGKDPQQTRQAIIGCVVRLLLFGGSSAVSFSVSGSWPWASLFYR